MFKNFRYLICFGVSSYVIPLEMIFEIWISYDVLLPNVFRFDTPQSNILLTYARAHVCVICIYYLNRWHCQQSEANELQHHYRLNNYNNWAQCYRDLIHSPKILILITSCHISQTRERASCLNDRQNVVMNAKLPFGVSEIWVALRTNSTWH